MLTNVDIFNHGNAVNLRGIKWLRDNHRDGGALPVSAAGCEGRSRYAACRGGSTPSVSVAGEGAA